MSFLIFFEITPLIDQQWTMLTTQRGFPKLGPMGIYIISVDVKQNLTIHEVINLFKLEQSNCETNRVQVFSGDLIKQKKTVEKDDNIYRLVLDFSNKVDPSILDIKIFLE